MPSTGLTSGSSSNYFHCQSSSEVSALCSHFTKLSGIWSLTFFHDARWYSLCFSVPSSFLQPRHFFSSDHPMSHSPFCTHAPTKCLITLRCLSVPSQHSLNWFQPNSIPHTRVWLSTCFKSIFFTSCGQATLISTATCPSKNKVCHRGHLMPRSRVPRMMPPQVLSPVSKSVLQRSASSTPSAALFSICPSNASRPKKVAMVDVLGLSSSQSRHSSTKQ